MVGLDVVFDSTCCHMVCSNDAIRGGSGGGSRCVFRSDMRSHDMIACPMIGNI